MILLENDVKLHRDGVEETVQWVKCLWCKREDLSLIPGKAECAVNHSPGKVETGRSLRLADLELAYLLSSKSVKDVSQKAKCLAS